MPTPTDDQPSDHPSSETEDEGETESVVSAFPFLSYGEESLAEKASNAAALKRRKPSSWSARTAIHGHSPTADFLLDCLPKQPKSQPTSSTRKGDMEKEMPTGVRRIDEFFSKPD
ncbi:hypothetical protein HPP92_002807 [Vanilla planifolia]|uniref:Uncharacterized protein n=1 Tax=Vanilla planifolia TaxID=51239 RepID=A0A835VIU3_VANPL|nr:hypothetical protein HPP92_002807 [Vanilla planifolia]